MIILSLENPASYIHKIKDRVVGACSTKSLLKGSSQKVIRWHKSLYLTDRRDIGTVCVCWTQNTAFWDSLTCHYAPCVYLWSGRNHIKDSPFLLRCWNCCCPMSLGYTSYVLFSLSQTRQIMELCFSHFGSCHSFHPATNGTSINTAKVDVSDSLSAKRILSQHIVHTALRCEAPLKWCYLSEISTTFYLIVGNLHICFT
jgi:hypothetical protein